MVDVSSDSPSEDDRPEQGATFSLRTLWFGVTLFCVCCSLCVVGVHQARRSANSRERYFAFRQMLIALHNYSDMFKSLPSPYWTDAAGKPTTSWRMALLPVCAEYSPWMDRMDLTVSWKRAVNRERIDLYAFIYQLRYCSPDEGYDTNVLAIVGPGTAFETDRPVKLKNVPAGAILLVEVHDSGIPWPAPGDLDIRDMPRCLFDDSHQSKLGFDQTGFLVGFADGEVWLLRHDVPFETLRRFFTLQDAIRFDREELLGPYRVQ